MPFMQNRKRKYGQRRRRVGTTLMLTLGLFAIPAATAQALDGTTIRKLALQGTWVAENTESGQWSWNAENTLCLRFSNQTGDCADTGTWTIKGDVMCYELTWWGESVGDRSNCFTVNALGGNRYEALYHGGALASTFIRFQVLE